jgi:hypothetical protein
LEFFLLALFWCLAFQTRITPPRRRGKFAGRRIEILQKKSLILWDFNFVGEAFIVLQELQMTHKASFISRNFPLVFFPCATKFRFCFSVILDYRFLLLDQ